MSSTSVAVFLSQVNVDGGFWMYYMLIGFIIVVIAVIGAGYILKRKHYQRINELEEKKINESVRLLMNFQK